MLTITRTNRLFLLQKRAIRLVSGAHFRAHTAPLFDTTRTINSFQLLPISHTAYTRAHAHQLLQIPHCRTTFKQNSLHYRLCKIHNDISVLSLINESSSILTLKKELETPSVILSPCHKPLSSFSSSFPLFFSHDLSL